MVKRFTDECMELNRHCYEFVLRPATRSGLLDASVDATYIIHLLNNGRYDAILDQVEAIRPTSALWMVLNKGFKACPKQLPKQVAGYDLADATLQIYKHAEAMGYENILILEDDCFFHEDLKKPEVQQDLNTVFQQMKDTTFSYRLGCIPFLMVPFVSHSSVGLYGGAHAYVTSASFRAAALNATNRLTDIDEYLNIAGSQYAYYKPLAYQLFPDTDNKATWGTNFSLFPYIFPLLAFFFKLFIRLIGLDVRAEPGFSFAYLVAKSLFASIILFVLLAIIGIIGLFFIYKKLNLRVFRPSAASTAK